MGQKNRKRDSRKKTTLLLVSGFLTVVIGCAIFFVSECFSELRRFQSGVATLTEKLSSDLEPFMIAGNPIGAEQALHFLGYRSEVMAAAVYDPQGRIFARYLYPEQIGDLPDKRPEAGHHFQDTTMILHTPLHRSGNVIGSVGFLFDIAPEQSILRRKLFVIAGLVIAVLISLIVFGAGIRKSFDEPALAMIEAARRVVDKGDYSLRVDDGSAHELTPLINVFNEMLSTIEEHETALMESTSSLEALGEQRDLILKSVGEGIIGMDANGIITFSNPAASHMLRWDLGELLGRSVSDIIQNYSVRKEVAMERINRFKRGIQNFSGKRSYEEVFYRKDGRPFYVEYVSTPLRDNRGDWVGSVLSFQDVTERKRALDALRHSEEKYSNLFHNSNDGIFLHALDGEIIDLNESAQKLFGGSKLEALTLKINDLYPSEVLEEFDYLFQSLANTGHLRFETMFKKKDGDQFPAEITATMFNIGGSEVVQGIVRDITERREAEQKLREYTEKLEASNRELRSFAFVASHDLQEPLRKVRAFGDRLKDKCGDQLGDDGKDYIERMQNAAGRMQMLINDVLAFSRVVAKPQPFETVQLSRVVSEILDDLMVRIEETGARIDVVEMPDVSGDHIQLKQLFQNLISNALKFHREDEVPLVRIRASRVIPPGEKDEAGQYQITVQDNGIGFDEKYLDKIFTVFQRLHTRKEFEGTGIGLAICRKIAERHGGSVTAKSEPGKGSIFIVTLPIATLAKSAPIEPELEHVTTS